jgi:hypothetical protein
MTPPNKNKNKIYALVALVVLIMLVLLVSLFTQKDKARVTTEQVYSNGSFSISKPTDFELASARTEFKLSNKEDTESITVSKFVSYQTEDPLEKITSIVLKNLDGTDVSNIRSREVSINQIKSVLTENESNSELNYYIPVNGVVWRITFSSKNPESGLIKTSEKIVGTFKVK